MSQYKGSAKMSVGLRTGCIRRLMKVKSDSYVDFDATSPAQKSYGVFIIKWINTIF